MISGAGDNYRRSPDIEFIRISADGQSYYQEKRVNMIECIGYKKIGKGTLEGFVNICVTKWGLEIYGLTHFVDKAQGKEWINLPKKEFTDPDGKKKYSTILKFKLPEHETKFLSMVKEAVDRYTNTMPTSANALPEQMEMPF